MDKKDRSLEHRLLQFYIVADLICTAVIALAYFTIKMPNVTVFVFLLRFLLFGGYFLLGYLVKKELFFGEIYFVLVLLSKPFLWYFAGGAKASASVLFAGEIVLFVMCQRGIKQKVFIALSFITTSLVQSVSQRMNMPGLPMEPQQYQLGGSVLGIASSLLMASLLIKQKKEYVKERDAALASERELARSNMLQKNFLANMSHEIRSPLGIVLGFNTLIGESEDINEIHDHSKDIAQAGSTLLTVINDILDYSKIESGKLDIIESDYSFPGLISEIRREISLKCDEKNLKFIVHEDSSIPEYLFGDNIRIKQCLLNVLSNAVKYTEKGAVCLGIKNLGLQEDGRYQISFVVKDTGKGISDAAMPKLFSAFQRLDEDTNRGIEGTGLGLAITKNLLDEMNGDIQVESELGKGTTFTIILSQGKGSGHTDIKPSVEKTDLSGKKALVVDDTELNLVLIKMMLQKEGMQVVTIDNGMECLAEVEKNKYDIILLDHMMPYMNGVEVFKNIREQAGLNGDTPVIMLTANAMVGASQEYMDMGFDGYISKPINKDEMFATIASLI